jgi:hypothetical protein
MSQAFQNQNGAFKSIWNKFNQRPKEKLVFRGSSVIHLDCVSVIAYMTRSRLVTADNIVLLYSRLPIKLKRPYAKPAT